MLESPITLIDLQRFIKNKDFNLDFKHEYFLKLVEEMGELADVMRKDRRFGRDSETIKGTIEEELYDVLYYVLALANVYGIDIEESCLLKEEFNRLRKDKRSEGR